MSVRSARDVVVLLAQLVTAPLAARHGTRDCAGCADGPNRCREEQP